MARSSTCYKEGNIPLNPIKPGEHRGRATEFKKGCRMSPETRLKMSQAKKGQKHWWSFPGEKNPNWIADRTKLAKRQERNDSAYREWRNQVWKRDGWKCMIADPNCEGKVVAHHILPWSKFPELRYKINNGITLCRHHHPRKRKDEMELSPYFQKLVTEAH